MPDDIWQRHTCIIIHPGIKGDRGPSSLDWTVMDQQEQWGVTALQACAEMDAGDIWATCNFTMRAAGKASLYRREVTQAAIQVILQTVRHSHTYGFRPEPLDYARKDVRGTLRALMKQADRKIDWAADTTAEGVRKIPAADSALGVLDALFGQECFLYGVHEESRLRGDRPGAIIVQRHGAVCRATVDGAVWISHFKKRDAIAGGRMLKLPAAMLMQHHLDGVPESPVDGMEPMGPSSGKTLREIWYEESGGVGYLHFDFHNGAMSTDQCQQLQRAETAWPGCGLRCPVIGLRPGNSSCLSCFSAHGTPASGFPNPARTLKGSMKDQ